MAHSDALSFRRDWLLIVFLSVTFHGLLFPFSLRRRDTLRGGFGCRGGRSGGRGSRSRLTRLQFGHGSVALAIALELHLLLVHILDERFHLLENLRIETNVRVGRAHIFAELLDGVGHLGQGELVPVEVDQVEDHDQLNRGQLLVFQRLAKRLVLDQSTKDVDGQCYSRLNACRSFLFLV